MPKLPARAAYMPPSGPCAAYDQDTESGGAAPMPTKQTMPVQGGGGTPASKYFATTEAQGAIPDDQRTVLELNYPGSVTTKSAYNALAKVPS